MCMHSAHSASIETFSILFPYGFSTQCFSKASIDVQLYVAPMAAAIALGASKTANAFQMLTCTTWHARKL